MEVQYSKLPKSRVLLNVELEEERVGKAFKKACKNISKKASVPGFRKGKVPRKILERTLGKEVIVDEARNLLLMEAYPAAIKEANLLPMGEPSLDVKTFEEGSPMVFTAEVDVKPEITLPDYKAISIDIEKEKFEVKDEFIEDSLNILRKQLSTPKEVTERGIQKGDFVDLDLQLSYPEKEDKGLEPQRKTCIFDENNFEPELIKEIEGMKKDESREFEITKTSYDEEGKEIGTEKVAYDVTVNSIREIEEIELTDELIEQNTKYKNLEEIKEGFRQEWEKMLADKRENHIKDTLIDKLLESAEGEEGFEIPESLLQSKVNSLLATQAFQLSKSHLNLDDYLNQIGMEKEAYMEKLREEADKIIKTDLILDAIGEAEKIEVPEEDFEDALKKIDLLREKGKGLKEEERKDLRDYMEVKLRKQKVLDFLIEKVQVSEN
jgi:trigger factor